MHSETSVPNSPPQPHLPCGQKTCTQLLSEGQVSAARLDCYSSCLLPWGFSPHSPLLALHPISWSSIPRRGRSLINSRLFNNPSISMKQAVLFSLFLTLTFVSLLSILLSFKFLSPTKLIIDWSEQLLQSCLWQWLEVRACASWELTKPQFSSSAPECREGANFNMISRILAPGETGVNPSPAFLAPCSEAG